jgi:murein DD-endopeptidase MepM/ murein hydrolase activator NlpD
LANNACVKRSLRRAVFVPAAVTAGLSVAAAPGAATQSATAPRLVAQAYAVRVVVPGSVPAGTPVTSAPPDTVSLEGAFAYPADGSAVATGSATASASSSVAATATARAASEVSSLSLFGGEITASRIAARARAAASAETATGDVSGSAVSNLVVLGQPASAGRVALADWGYADVAAGTASHSRAEKSNSSQAKEVALDVHLTTAHGGLPTGTEIVVGYAEAHATVARVVAAPPRPEPPPPPPPPATTKPPEPKRSPFGPPPIRTKPPGVHPQLTAGGYVFPVYGPVSWSDTFGAPRADTGWHHGDDLFAPLGAPVLAVARGMLFSVGWNDIGGNRVWLRDDQGNQFYYAHLSAFSPLAVNGRRVDAGDVLGFVGNTGDAEGTPYHLHFEIHPVSLLHLGYDGVVDPTPYLSAWQHLRDLNFPGFSGKAWAPGVAAGAAAPEPGAILLQATDISQANGLDPGSFAAVIGDAARAEGDRALLRRTAPAVGRG